MRKLFSILTIVSIASVAIPFSVGAATITAGNDIISRATVDTASNFTIIDTNHPASSAGVLSSFSYYVNNTNTFRFVLVNSSNIVKWVSDEITPSTIGVGIYTPGTTVPVETGWNLGVYFKTTGSIPFDAIGNNAYYTAADSGKPAVNDTLTLLNAGSRTYSFSATGSTELPGTLQAQDFGVVNYDTGTGILKGYTSGFGLTDATITNAQSVIIKLYSGTTLLQTNTATNLFKTTITGIQFSSPFDIFGTFNYTTDGYWTNLRASEYGQTMVPTKVTATVILANGKTVTAENTNPTGDPATIYPVVLPGTLHAEDFGVVTYDTGLGILKGYTAGFGLTDATFNGATSVVVKLYHNNVLLQTNTGTAKFKSVIIGDQFSSPFDIFGTFNYLNDGYWTNVREVQYGQSPSFIPNKVVATVVLANGKTVTAQNTTPSGDPTTIYPTVPPVNPPSEKDKCKNGGWKTFTDPSFKNQGQCVSFMNGRADNHGIHVSQSENKKEAAQSTIGMPEKSKKGKDK